MYIEEYKKRRQVKCLRLSYSDVTVLLNLVTREKRLMKYMKQLGIIFAVTCVGEILKYLIPFPVPASIYGLVIMLVLLLTRKVKLEQVQDVADFLIEIMPMMFIPAAVGLLVSWEQLKSMLVPVVVITIVSTVVVMGVTGKVSDVLTKERPEGRKDVK